MSGITADRVVVELEARLDRYEANVARAEAKFDKAMSGIQKSAGVTEAFVSRAAGIMSSALAGVSVIALTRQFLTLADEAKKLDATLKLATQGFGSFGQAQKDVNRIANDTRSGLSETASLYANFVRGAKELGGTQAEAARATETFSKTLKISGADANQAASATLQFGQALAAGALRGDELNSILEASPRLARLLAESMGQPIGQIKQLGEEGKLTSEKLLAALTDQKFTAGIDAEFNQLPVTFGDAMTRISNAALTTFSAFDQGGQFSSMLASFFGESADGFAQMEESAFDAGAEIRATFAGLADVFQPLIDGAFAAFDQIEGRANYARDSIANILRLVDNVDNTLIGIDNFGRRFDNRIKSTINEAARRAGNTGGEFSMTPLAKEADRAGQFLKAFNQSMATSQGERAEDRFRRMVGGTDVLGNPLPGTPAAGRGKPAATPASSGSKKSRTPRSPLNPEAFAREEAQLNSEILRLKTVELTNSEDRAKVELQRIEANKAAAIADVQADKRYTDAQKAKIVALTETVAALEAGKVIYERDVQTAKEAVDIRVNDLRNQQDILRAQGGLAQTREQRRDIELRLLDLAYQQERAELDAVIASKDASDAQKKIAQARLDALGQMQQAETDGVNQQYEGPLARYRRRMDETSTQDQVEELITQELDYVRDGIRDSITKRLGVKDPFLAGIIDMFIQQQLIKPLMDSFSGGGKFSGFSLESIGKIFSSAAGGGETGTGVGFASGGTATLGGRGGTDRNTLSLNGRPIANVTRGETLSVGSKAIRAGGGNQPTVYAPQFNLAGAVVTAELYADMERISRDSSTRAAGAAYAQSQQSMPGTLNKFTQLKGG
ncbi:tape measure protein [Sphingobium yanoikuyae]|uniref:tape measure protein n=1 Tax=Sphingobium yanoikuyae TaxID=13690 RepID=UPI0026EB1AEA|nr:tape measure protein [Sphingobium yanoikuyae]